MYALLVFIPLTIYARPPDARSLALGGAYPLSEADASTLFQNPALLVADAAAWSVGFHAFRPYGMGDLTTGGVSFVRIAHLLGFGIGATSFALHDYRETVGSAALSLRLSRRIRAGLSFDVTDVSVASYERTTRFGLSAGVVAHLSQDLSAALHGRSLASRSRGELWLPSSRTLSLVGEYVALRGPSPRLRLSGIITHEDAGQWASALALIIEPKPALRLSLGRTTGPSGFTGGCEVRAYRSSLGYGVRFHPDLDATQAITLVVGF